MCLCVECLLISEIGCDKLLLLYYFLNLLSRQMWWVLGTSDTCRLRLTFAFFLSLFLLIFNAPLWRCSPLSSLRPPTLVNWTCSGSAFLWPFFFFESACESGKRHHEQSSQGTLYEPLGCVMFVYLACLPPIILCVCGLARFAGHDAWLSWWKCILA